MRKLILGAVLLAMALPAFAAEKIPQQDLWLGLGAGAVLGFGSGQAVQGRWNEIGWPFTVADGVAMVALLSTFGDCMNCSSSSRGTQDAVRVAGIALLGLSRVAQVGELVHFGLQHGIRIAVAPTESTGAIACASLEF